MRRWAEKTQSQRLVIYRFFLLAQTHKKHRTDIDTKINTYALLHSIIMVPQRPPQHMHQAINQNAIIQHANNPQSIVPTNARHNRTHDNHRFNHPFHTSIIATNNVNKEHRNNKHINHSNTINPSMIRVVLRPSTTHAASSIEYYRISPIEYRQYH